MAFLRLVFFRLSGLFHVGSAVFSAAVHGSGFFELAFFAAFFVSSLFTVLFPLLVALLFLLL
ncbi:hypothetical protein, partial [Klebsiella pneumoniae]|uniref:hypothetical protein n=1 Tax=Klebsiella pneumoniae TaxID=573 RepID=UPI003B5CA103